MRFLLSQEMNMNLNQVTIYSTDVEKAVEFYKLLGLRLIVDSLPRYVRFECVEGDSTLSLSKVDDLPTGQRMTIYFQNENLDKAVQELIEKGLEFTLLPTDQPWLWPEAHLNDYDGNTIILYSAGDNRKNPPWRIN